MPVPICKEAELKVRQEQLERTVREYFEGCNKASRERLYSVLADDVVHYFPLGVGGPYKSKEAVANLWLGFVREKGSRWTIDRLVSSGNEVAVEWTHFKPKVGEVIRGAEWYEFNSDGKIVEIRAYYASPRNSSRKINELEGFPYAEKGFAIEPPGGLHQR